MGTSYIYVTLDSTSFDPHHCKIAHACCHERITVSIHCALMTELAMTGGGGLVAEQNAAGKGLGLPPTSSKT